MFYTRPTMTFVSKPGQWVIALAVALIIGASTQPSFADVLHLKSGKSVDCTVTGYADMTFEVTGTSANKYQSLLIRSIDFEPRVGPSSVDTRSRGTLKATIKSYADSAFAILNDKGQPEAVSAVFVTRVTMAALPEKEIDSNDPGGGAGDEEVNLNEKMVRGKVNIVEFYFAGHPACRLVTAYLDQLVAKDNDLSLIKINIGAWESPVAKQHQVTSVPRVDIYGRSGKKLGSVDGNRQPMIGDLVKKAKQS